MKQSPKVWTIGHSNRTITEFISLLKTVNIQIVIDVRSKPRSRFYWFNSAKLTEYLAEAGIVYEHQPSIGGFIKGDDYTEVLDSVATKNKMLIVAKRLSYLLYVNGIIDRDISNTVKCFQQSKVHKRQGLTEEEQVRIVHWINRNPDRVRERTLIYLLLFQGLRQAEVCNLRYCDVDFRQNCLHVLGKGRDDKEPLIMQEDVRRTLKEYVEKTPIGMLIIFCSRVSAGKAKMAA